MNTATQPPVTPTPAATPATAIDDVVAQVGETSITRSQLVKPLIEAYGLNMLAKVAQLELAKFEARHRGLNVTPADVKAETERYLASLFDETKDRDLKQLNEELEKAEVAKNAARIEQIKHDIQRERNMLLEQLLQQQKVTRVDFNMVMETNAYLRAIAEAVIKSQPPITDSALHSAFGHLYGEKVVVRDIQVADMREVAEVKRRLGAGEPFEMVARQMSRHPPSAAMGGELQPFSRETPDFPQNFRDVAFALKVGEVSDAVLIGDAYHIIKLEQRIAPRLVKFEDVKESVREFLAARQLELTTQGLRSGLQQQVVSSLKINDPVLQQQFDAQRNRKAEVIEEKADMKRELDRRIQQDRANRAATAPTTAPVAPSRAPSTQPTTR